MHDSNRVFLISACPSAKRTIESATGPQDEAYPAYVRSLQACAERIDKVRNARAEVARAGEASIWRIRQDAAELNRLCYDRQFLVCSKSDFALWLADLAALMASKSGGMRPDIQEAEAVLRTRFPQANRPGAVLAEVTALHELIEGSSDLVRLADELCDGGVGST